MNSVPLPRKPMRLLVTGGAGFVGSHTCVALLEAGHDVVVVDDFSNSTVDVLQTIMDLTGRTLEWIEADIRDHDMITAVVARNAFDAVLHFAALKSAPESTEQPLHYWDVNVAGTVSLLRVALSAGIEKFVFSSSAIVYGGQEVLPISESALPNPMNPYAETKLACERLLQNVARSRPGFRVCILRYFNPIGAHPSGRIGEDPRQRATNLFPIVLAACRDGTSVDILGTNYGTPDGSAIRDFIHVMDIADGHAAALDFLTGNISAAEPNAWTFNLGTGTGCSVLQVIDAMEKVSGVPIPRRAAGRRAGDIAVSIADPSRGVSLLGWRSRRSLEDACRDALRWSKNLSEGRP